MFINKTIIGKMIEKYNNKTICSIKGRLLLLPSSGSLCSWVFNVIRRFSGSNRCELDLRNRTILR